MTIEDQLKEYLRGETMSPELEASIIDPTIRRALYRQIVNQAAHPFRPLLLRLLREEISFRKALWNGEVEDTDDYFEGIYHCAFLLSRCGDPSDTEVLWSVMYLNQDIGELDVGNFVGAGVEETLAFLDQAQNNLSEKIAAYIRESLDHPHTRQWLQSWESGCRESIGIG
jgi:hypothetical protein